MTEHEALPSQDAAQPMRLSEILSSLAIVGASIYGLLWVGYATFYGSLGIEPSDVGLSYTDVIERSFGFVALLVVVCALFFLMFRVAGSNKAARRIVYSLAILVVLVLIVLNGFAGASAATALKQGRPVLPFEAAFRGNGFTILAIRASPLTIVPPGKPEEAPGIRSLSSSALFYLGQKGGTAVLYEAGRSQRAIYIPTSAAVMTLSNCTVSPPQDKRCFNAWTRMRL